MTMRLAIVVWRQLREKKHDELAQHIRWSGDGVGLKSVIFDSHPELPEGVAAPLPDLHIRESVADRGAGSEWLARFSMDDPCCLQQFGWGI
jgi:hypothetical protein